MATSALSFKYGHVPGRIPKQVRLTALCAWDKGKRRAARPNTNYFAFPKGSKAKTKDWGELGLETSKLGLMEMHAPRTSKAKKNKKDVLIDNGPMKVKLASAETFSSYGSGNKESLYVTLPEGYVVPISADVFFESLVRDGFNNKTKELNSTFTIAVFNRVTGLVRIGSDLHEACLEQMEIAKLPKLDVKTMSVGEVFETKSGIKALFLGFVTTKYLVGCDKVKRKVDYDSHTVVKTNVKYSTMKIGTLWYDLTWNCRTGNSSKLQEDFDRGLSEGGVGRDALFKTKSGHGFVNRNKNLKITVPTDIIRTVRLAALRELSASLKRQGHMEKWLLKAAAEKKRRQLHSGDLASHNYRRSYKYPVTMHDLNDMFALTKKTNMIVFGMHSEATEVSRRVENLVQLFNKIEEEGLDREFNY